MIGLDLVKFTAEHADGVISCCPVDKAESFFNRLIEADQVIPKFHRGALIGFAAYYRTCAPREELQHVPDWSLPEQYSFGPYVFVDLVVIHPKYRKQRILEYFVDRIKKLKPYFHAGFWLEQDGIWHAQERAENMQSNCGILAFDKITGMLNGRANVISLSTLARIAQDNEFLLFPMKVQREDLPKLTYPFVLHNDFHFETISNPFELGMFELPDSCYVLTQSDEIGQLVDDDEAKSVRGSKKFWKQILAPIIGGPFVGFLTDSRDPWQKAGNWAVGAGSGALTGLLIGGPIGAAVGAGVGGAAVNMKTAANPNEKTNITGQSMLSSGLLGGATGAAGAGVATGIGGLLAGGAAGAGAGGGYLASTGTIAGAAGTGSGGGAAGLAGVGGTGAAFGAGAGTGAAFGTGAGMAAAGGGGTLGAGLLGGALNSYNANAAMGSGYGTAGLEGANALNSATVGLQGSGLGSGTFGTGAGSESLGSSLANPAASYGQSINPGTISGSAAGSGQSSFVPGNASTGGGMTGPSTGTDLSGMSGADTVKQAATLQKGASAGSKVMKMLGGGQGLLGLGLTGAGMVGQMMNKGTNLTMPEDLNSSVSDVQSMIASGGATPQSRAASQYLTTAIPQGPAGAYAPVSDAYTQAMLNQMRLSTDQNRLNYETQLAKTTGGPFSSDWQQNMANYNSTVGTNEAAQIAAWQEAARKQGSDVHTKYLELAAAGDATAYQYLVQAYGDRATADYNIQMYKAGQSAAPWAGLQNVGGTLLGNSINPRRPG